MKAEPTTEPLTPAKKLVKEKKKPSIFPLLNKPKPNPPPATKPLQTATNDLFVAVGDLIELPDKDNWLIQDYLELDSTALIYGSSGTGKSFVAVDIACSIATGTDWHGHTVEEQGAVFYIAGEGHSGFKKRFKAWEQTHSISLKGTPLFLSNKVVTLPDKDNCRPLINTINKLVEAVGHKPKLIIIDTLARCLDGDENSAKDIGAFIQDIDRIRIEYGCCVLVVHHSGKVEERGARGSSALKSAMDTELALTNKSNVIELTNTKQKNHELAKPIHFKLDKVVLSDEINSAVLTLVTKEGTIHTAKLGKNDKPCLEALNLAMVSDVTPPNEDVKQFCIDNGIPTPPTVVHIDKWCELTLPTLTQATPKDKKNSFSRSVKKLKNNKQIATNDEIHYWVIAKE